MLQLILTPLWLISSLIYYFIIATSFTLAFRLIKNSLSRQNLRPISSKSAVLITGATSGIGLAVSKHLYNLGYSLIVAYYDSKEIGYLQLKQLKDKRKNGEQKMIFVELDIRSQESISKAYDETSNFLKENQLNLWALINNAGIGSLQPFAWIQRRTIKSIVDTNLLGSLMMTREFLPLIVQSRGRIINVSSALALIPGINYLTYGITKSALLYFTRCLNLELGSGYDVKAVCVMPHNHIKSTNICATNVENNQSALEEMKPLERQIYKDDYEKQCKLAKELEEAIKEQSRKIQVTGSSNISSRKRPYEGQQTSLRGAIELVVGIITRLKGKSASLTLEESGLLEGFEEALRLPNPPEQLFAGDNIFNYIVGSILLTLPVSCTNILSKAISSSLYK